VAYGLEKEMGHQNTGLGLGGGTFDVSILEWEMAHSVLAANSDNKLGETTLTKSS
jgi:molecular chaperone DnaK (HSP70)